MHVQISDSSDRVEFVCINGFLLTGSAGFMKPLFGSLLGKRDFFLFFLFSLFFSLSMLASDYKVKFYYQLEQIKLEKILVIT